jgi:N-acetylglucosaminyl-diphospho-decaprenol L-rhamnosyltransferase
MADVGVVVVTYNAEPYLERCLDSVRGYETVVVDHGSTDGTLELLRSRFPDVRLVEQENLGLAAGWNRGMRELDTRYYLIHNADAWALGDAVERLLAFAEEHPEAAVVGPRLLWPDGSLQVSVRTFPTLWRLATEFLFLRKLAPRSRAFNAFYGAGFDHESVAEVEWLAGACMLVRREAVEQVGPLDEDYFLFSEETDWHYRFRQAGWKVLFFPGAVVVHVLGASHGGRMFRELVKGHVLWFAKHRGPREAERARRLLLLSLRLRMLLLPRRRAIYRDAAHWLGSAPVPALLDSGR